VNVKNPTEVGIPVEILKKYFVVPNSQEYFREFIFIGRESMVGQFLVLF
jgi:hypothetical protein